MNSIGLDSIDSAPVTAVPFTRPNNLQATPGDGEVVLTWNTVPGAVGYRIYRNGTPIATITSDDPTSLPPTTYPDTGLNNGATYSYGVRSVNIDGFESVTRATVSVTLVDPDALAAPTGLMATRGTGVITLSWDAVVGAASYSVYRNGVRIATNIVPPAPDSTTVTYPDMNFISGSFFSYAVRAQDNNGVESAASGSVIIVAP